MRHKELYWKRDPKKTKAWLIGGGIESLTAAVKLIQDALVPPGNIQVIETCDEYQSHVRFVRGIEAGSLFSPGATFASHSVCLKELLSTIPSYRDVELSALSAIESVGQRANENDRNQPIHLTRSGLSHVGFPDALHGCLNQRWGLIKLMTKHEKSLDGKSVEDCFDKSFFESTFWELWSTTFCMQPRHSAIEFRRQLREYLQHSRPLYEVDALGRLQYAPYQYVIQPIEAYLKGAGVVFHRHCKANNLITIPAGDPSTVVGIEYQDAIGPHLITIDPADIVIVTVGSMKTGSSTGTNTEAPISVEESPMSGDWAMWFRLASRSTKFGSPIDFHNSDTSAVVSFTATFRNAEFWDRYKGLAHSRPGTVEYLSIIDSKWQISIRLSPQLVSRTQCDDTRLISGYGLFPSAVGDYVSKPMLQCSGQEILTELLHHLNFPVESILPHATTVPCLIPLATSAMAVREKGSRPKVIPDKTTNIALVGQFVEIPMHTTGYLEYSVRSAEIAVTELMGLNKSLPGFHRNVLFQVLDLLLS